MKFYGPRKSYDEVVDYINYDKWSNYLFLDAIYLFFLSYLMKFNLSELFTMEFLFLVIMCVFNFSLTTFNFVCLGMLLYIFIEKFKIFKHNPYRTSPICLICIIFGIQSILLIDFQFFFNFFESYYIFYLGFIWTSALANCFFAIYTILYWHGRQVRSMVVHINMLLNTTYLILAIFDETFSDPINLIAIGVAIFVVIVAHYSMKTKKYGPAPAYIPEGLDDAVKFYISIFKTKTEKVFLDKLTKSDNEYVANHAKKTLQLYSEGKITKSNVKNNLFLLILINRDIPIGKFRKLFYENGDK